MRPEKKQALAEFHRTQILDAAQQLFERKGMEGTTIEDLAKEAGYSKATIYVYFKNKDEIAGGIALRGMRQLRERISRAVEQPGDWLAAYDALCDAVAGFYEENPAAYEAAAGRLNVDLQDPETPQVYRDIYEEGEEVNRLAVRFLARGEAAGLLKEGLDRLQVVFLFWASLSGLVRMASQKRAYLESRLQLSRETFLRGCYRRLLDSIMIEGQGK